ncbi:hypothetical protein PIROE2DRAFT_18730 [Piromyces sp. E2]|nr:hypothetical protein PIROE2DRAFT_18730 [Piromyces sp. E2]|eukprot:OUM56593.1 hypothetical protein PIROE2DRAFT_18730 [Piromyces sp. E2]
MPRLLCPEISGGVGFTYEFSCSYTFYCIDDNCQPDRNFDSPFFEYTETNGNVTKYIKRICPKESAEGGKCTTEKCTTDSDCMSNKCFNGVCVSENNSSSPSIFTECSDVVDDADMKNQFQKMKCGRLNGEKCTGDGQCAGRCFTTSDSPKTCNSHYLIYIGVGILVAAVIVCICTRCLIGKSNKAHKRRCKK